MTRCQLNQVILESVNIHNREIINCMSLVWHHFWGEWGYCYEDNFRIELYKDCEQPSLKTTPQSMLLYPHHEEHNL